MNKPYGIVVAAALAVSGMLVAGCHNSDTNNPPPPSSVGGVSGGGSTDSYGTSTNARYKSTGNIGVDTGAQPATPPAPVRNDTTYGNNPPAPPQTPVGPSGSTGSTGTGTSTTGNTGNYQGSTTGRESGEGVRTEVRPPANSNTNTNGNTSAPFPAAGGTTGNGTNYRNGPTTNPSESGRSETGRSETSGTTR